MGFFFHNKCSLLVFKNRHLFFKGVYPKIIKKNPSTLLWYGGLWGVINCFLCFGKKRQYYSKGVLKVSIIILIYNLVLPPPYIIFYILCKKIQKTSKQSSTLYNIEGKKMLKGQEEEIKNGICKS